MSGIIYHLLALAFLAAIYSSFTNDFGYIIELVIEMVEELPAVIYLLFIPITLNSYLIFRYGYYMKQSLEDIKNDDGEGQQNASLVTLSLLGVSVSGLFALLLSQPSALTAGVNYQTPILLIGISVIALLMTFLLDYHAHKKQDEQLGVMLEEIGKFGLVLSMLTLMWETPMQPWIPFTFSALLGYALVVFNFKSFKENRDSCNNNNQVYKAKEAQGGSV